MNWPPQKKGHRSAILYAKKWPTSAVPGPSDDCVASPRIFEPLRTSQCQGSAHKSSWPHWTGSRFSTNLNHWWKPTEMRSLWNSFNILLSSTPKWISNQVFGEYRPVLLAHEGSSSSLQRRQKVTRKQSLLTDCQSRSCPWEFHRKMILFVCSSRICFTQGCLIWGSYHFTDLCST